VYLLLTDQGSAIIHQEMSTYKQGFVSSCVAVVLLAQLAAISGQRFAVPDVKANVESLREGAVAADGGSSRLLPFLDPAVLDRCAHAADSCILRGVQAL